MRMVDNIYIDGKFVIPHGVERFDLFDPARGEVIGQVRLADAEDTKRAVQAAKRAFPAFAATSKVERLELLHRLHDAMLSMSSELEEATILEYGAPVARAKWGAKYAAEAFLNAAKTLKDYNFSRPAGSAEVLMEPLGVAGLITPWNANAGFICNKLAYALAAGCTAVIKPSEMGALQTEVVTQALHLAGAPAGVFNIVTGLGDVVGAELSRNHDIAKISFTGSTAVGKAILKAGAETLKRVTLELGGKSPTLILEDADLDAAVPAAITAGFQNSGQACLAGTRIIVPEARLSEVLKLARAAVEATKVGDLRNPATAIGPMVSKKQYDRVQHYIHLGIEAGATLLARGEGHPQGLGGFFVRPTVFADVTNNMTIVREEIFGPVLCILSYRDEEEAIRIANDTDYGLSAYVVSSNVQQARAVATRLQAGRVVINGAPHEPLAPFGGHKQSGIGREYGVLGLEAFLEAKAILGAVAIQRANGHDEPSQIHAPEHRSRTEHPWQCGEHEILLQAAIAGASFHSVARLKKQIVIASFEIAYDQPMVDDLQGRLAAVRWNDAVTTNWDQGTESGFLAAVIGYWRDHYNWRERLTALNRLPHYRATIDGHGVHFLHFRGRGDQPVPLLLMNGWPSSFVEYQRLAPLLRDGDPSFDVVIPTHPGFGFSDRPKVPYQVESADLYPKLMTALGHDRFVVAGIDIGSGIATRIALHHPHHVLALHVSAVAPKPDRPGDKTATEAETAYARRAATWSMDEGGYQAIQSSKPQTLAFGLADSPVGLASWILEKFHGWTDCQDDLHSVWPMETLIDNLMIYWATNTIGSSVQFIRCGQFSNPIRQNVRQALLALASGLEDQIGNCLWLGDHR